MKNIKIDLLKPFEWRVYKAIQLEAFKEEPSSFGTSYAEWVDASDKKWQERPSDKDSLIFVAKDEETAVGVVGVTFEGEEDGKAAYIWGMYVNRKYRGMGLGKKLLKTIVEAVKKTAQVKRIKLMVEYDPTPAQRLYKSVGFQPVGTTDYKLGDGKQHKLYKMEMFLK